MAVRTLADLITDARVLLQDTREPFRYRTPELWTNLNVALMTARRLRPDLYLGQFGAERYDYDPAVDGVMPFPLAAFYWEAAVEFIAGRAELRDDEFTTDNRAVSLINRFTAKLLGVTA